MILSLDLTYNRSLQALSHHDIRCQLSLETVTEGAHDGLNRWLTTSSSRVEFSLAWRAIQGRGSSVTSDPISLFLLEECLNHSLFAILYKHYWLGNNITLLCSRSCSVLDQKSNFRPTAWNKRASGCELLFGKYRFALHKLAPVWWFATEVMIWEVQLLVWGTVSAARDRMSACSFADSSSPFPSESESLLQLAHWPIPVVIRWCWALCDV